MNVWRALKTKNMTSPLTSLLYRLMPSRFWLWLWRFFEAIVLVGSTALIGQVVFLDWFNDSLGQIARGYWMFLFITFVAIRLGLIGAAVMVLLTGIQAYAGALIGTGFFGDDRARTGLMNYWFYMIILTIVGISVAYYVTNLEKGYAELQSLRRSEHRATAILKQMETIAHVGGWRLDLPDLKLSWTEETFRIHELDPAIPPSLDDALNFYAPEARPAI